MYQTNERYDLKKNFADLFIFLGQYLEIKKQTCIFAIPNTKGKQIIREFSSAGSEHLPYKQRVTGSNPVIPTKASEKSEAFLFLSKTYNLGSIQTAVRHIKIIRNQAQSGSFAVKTCDNVPLF